MPRDQSRTLVRGQQTAQQTDEGRLASAIRPQQAEDLGLPDLQVHAIHGRHVAEAFPEAARLDRVLRDDPCSLFPVPCHLTTSAGMPGLSSPSPLPRPIFTQKTSFMR